MTDEGDDTLSTGMARVSAPPGELPLRRYTLGDVIGKGGMGEVVSAHDEQIGRSVAIKRLRVAHPSDEAVSRFLREARIQGRLEHPAIVPVYELWQDDAGRPCFVMKQLAGVTLLEVLDGTAVADGQWAPPSTAVRAKVAATSSNDRKAGPFSRHQLLRAFVEVCLAVELAHRRGIIHRDLKPANIVLGELGEVYVLDWGVARVVADAGAGSDLDTLGGDAASSHPDDRSPAPGTTIDTAAGALLGTPGYMAPEQIQGEPDLDRRADVYSLGCILFEILAGRSLHPHGQPGLASALAGVDARPSVRAPDREIPPELDAVCVAATARERADRTATARELADAVQAYLDGDRDLALRRQLAQKELAVAHAALASLESELALATSSARVRDRTRAAHTDKDIDIVAQRRSAMRAASRALALDPHSREAAELVGRLMIEPPDRVPAEVEAELERLDREALQAQSRTVSRAMLGYLVFFPVLYAMGFREPWFLVAAPLLAVAVYAGCRIYVARPHPALVTATLVASAALVFVFARVATPLLVAPSLALITAVLFAMHPRAAHALVLWPIFLVAVLAPWGLELLGVWSRMTFIADDHLVLRLGAEGLDETLGYIGLSLYAAVILALAIVLTRSQAHTQRAIQRVVQIQAWQLRQLIPTAIERV